MYGKIGFVVAHQSARGGKDACPKLLGDGVFSPRPFLNDAHDNVLRGTQPVKIALGR